MFISYNDNIIIIHLTISTHDIYCYIDFRENQGYIIDKEILIRILKDIRIEEEVKKRVK